VGCGERSHQRWPRRAAPVPWLKAIGEDYIAEAFRAAHEADPDAILIYNDYNIELGYKRPKAIQLLKSLIDQKVPIHAVGIQGTGAWIIRISPKWNRPSKSFRRWA
jgi:GH35 family endo-1,4-beta-xylanase